MIKYKAVWIDGYITNIMLDSGYYRLEGNRRAFNTLSELESYYKGKIKSMELIGAN